MTMTNCCQVQGHNNSSYNNSYNGQITSHYQPNNLQLQSSAGHCLPHHQLPIIDDNSGAIHNHRRHADPNLQSQISHRNPHTIIQTKESLITSRHPNNYCNVPTSHIAQCVSPYQITTGNIGSYHHQHQSNIGSQPTRRRHHTCDDSSSYQSSMFSSGQYIQSPPHNVNSGPLFVSSCASPGRTLSTNPISFPLTIGHNSNQRRFTTYPIMRYQSQPHQNRFARTSVPVSTIVSHTASINPTVQIPTVLGEVNQSMQHCHHCSIMTGSNSSPMLQLSVAPTSTSLITLAAVAGDRNHSSRIRYVPVRIINNWPNHNPYLPATWACSDLISILHNSRTRHVLQDQLPTQRHIAICPRLAIQCIIIAPSTILGHNDIPHTRHHFVPFSNIDPLSPIVLSRHLPFTDHLPISDQPKLGITKQELNDIPVKKFTKNEIGETDEDKDRCMICLEDFESNEFIRVLKCSHDFHSGCVERWLKINRTCPLCRTDTTSR